MKQKAQAWQISLAFALLVWLGFQLWRASQPRPIEITDVPRGANADNALTINMDGH